MISLITTLSMGPSDISSFLLPTAFIPGVFSHLFFFNHGERHRVPQRYLQFYLLAYIAGASALVNYGHLPLSTAFRISTAWAAVYFLGLFSSLVIYRLFFNPLNAFPGPYMARLSHFHCVLANAKHLNQHINLLALHRKYGRYVRIGPNSLSITDAKGLPIVLGPNTKCYRGSFYDMDWPVSSLVGQRPKAAHDKRMRIWSPAFSDRALKGYETRIMAVVSDLVSQVSAHADQPMNASLWFNCFAFDVMGDLSFGKSYGMVNSGEQHWSLRIMSTGMQILGFGLPDWSMRLLQAIPGLLTATYRYYDYCNAQLAERMEMPLENMDQPDVMATLLENYHKTPGSKNKLGSLQADSRLLIVAGSDTASATLSNLFYYIARDAKLQDRLRTEIRDAVGVDPVAFPHLKIIDLPLLNGCINETLRLNPPVPSGVYKTTPPEGITIGDTYVPGGTITQFPNYVLARDEANYVDCDAFVPERWSSRPDMVKQKEAFAPFSLGTLCHSPLVTLYSPSPLVTLHSPSPFRIRSIRSLFVIALLPFPASISDSQG